MSSELPILYSFRRCPYAMRARMALLTAGLLCEMREVILRDRPEHMMEISPKGTVPVLLLNDGTVLEESLDIMDWALEMNDPYGWLEYNSELGNVEDLILENDDEFKHHLDRYKYSNRYEDVDSIEHRDAAESFIAKLEMMLEDSPYLFGKNPTKADFAIFPFIRQFANTDRKWFDATKYSNVQVWLHELVESEIFKSCMVKYQQWKEGDQLVTLPKQTN